MAGRMHPVFVSHVKEIEQMAYYTEDLKHRLQADGNVCGEKYDCAVRVRAKCHDLLLRLYAEDTDIILMDDTDYRWIRKIVWYVHNIILKDTERAG